MLTAPRADVNELREQLAEAQARLSAPPPQCDLALQSELPSPPLMHQLAEPPENPPTCPITCDLIENPVVLSDGWSYEREAVETWVKIQQEAGKTAVSPMSRKVCAGISCTRLLPHAPHTTTLSSPGRDF